MSLKALSNCALVLLCCSRENAEAWEELIQTTPSVVTGTVFRVARIWNETRTEVLEELVQEPYLHLYCKGRQVLRKFHAENDEAISHS